MTEYILDHQDDAAQEDRWRTTMKRAMGKSFREQHEEVLAVKAALMHKVETEMQSMQIVPQKFTLASIFAAVKFTFSSMQANTTSFKVASTKLTRIKIAPQR